MAETTANEIQNEITTTSTGVMARTGSAISELRRMAEPTSRSESVTSYCSDFSSFCRVGCIFNLTTTK